MRRMMVVGFLWTMAAAAAFAGDVKEDRSSDVLYSFYAWSGPALPGKPDVELKTGGGFEIRGPIAWRDVAHAWGEIGLRVDLESVPEKSAFSFADVGTWGTVVDFRGEFGKRVGILYDSGDVPITTTLILRGSFSTATKDDDQVRRFYRGLGVGVRFEHFGRGWVSFVYGRDETVGVFGWGQLQVDGAVRLGKTPLWFDGKAGLGFGDRSAEFLQTDYVLMRLRVDVDDVIESF